MEINRGDIFYANLGDESISKKVHSHIQSGTRPVLVVSNNIGNKYSDIVIVIPITTANKKFLPLHFKYFHKASYGIVLCEQLLTISKTQLTSKIDELTHEEMLKVNDKIKQSIGLRGE